LVPLGCPCGTLGCPCGTLGCPCGILVVPWDVLVVSLWFFVVKRRAGLGLSLFALVFFSNLILLFFLIFMKILCNFNHHLHNLRQFSQSCSQFSRILLTYHYTIFCCYIFLCKAVRFCAKVLNWGRSRVKIKCIVYLLDFMHKKVK
jgi:hypothetical protein